MDSQLQLSQLAESIIRTLAYYDLFDYPLSATEIFCKLPTNHTSLRAVESELPMLEQQSIVFRFGKYYSLQNNQALEHRRVQGNQLAEKLMRIAMAKAKLIARFPFVLSVMVSGSLSKGYADEQSDIDFFIITQPGRLWIARMLLVLYKRIFLMNSHKYFCVNYFIDSAHLEIGEKNIFTATELATLIPLSGARYHQQLIEQNPWIEQYFPNFKPDFQSDKEVDESMSKRKLEWIFNRCFPDWLDRFFMQLTFRRWKKMYGQSHAGSQFEIAFKTNRHVSKNHPKNYQLQVVKRFEARVDSYKKYFKNYTMA